MNAANSAAFDAGAEIDLLLIEDDLVDEMALLKAVQEQGLPYRIRVARSVAQAREALAQQGFDIVLADYSLGDGSALDLLDAFQGQLVVLVAGMGEEQIAVRALEMGVHDYLMKDPQRGYLRLLKWRVAAALRQTQMARQLQASQAVLRATLDAVPDLLFELDAQGRYHDYHSARSDLLLAPPDLFLGKNVAELMPANVAAQVMASVAQAQETGSSYGQQIQLDLPQGVMWFELSVVLKRDSSPSDPRFVILSRDITARKHNEEALHQSLQDKEALLKEVHHRVKNNLQVITSLLRLEAHRSSQAGSNTSTKAVLDDMQGRIRSMALLHETLYRSGMFAGVDLAVYLGQVATQVFRMQATGRVRLTLDLASIKVSMDQATPCGLLLNELLTNCFKHGFADHKGGDGEVKVGLQALADGGRWRLSVSDNGAGLAPDFEAKRADSLGLKLVDDLARQLGAQLEISAGPVAEFGVSFRPL